jgi:hypothetical protein
METETINADAASDAVQPDVTPAVTAPPSDSQPQSTTTSQDSAPKVDARAGADQPKAAGSELSKQTPSPTPKTYTEEDFKNIQRELSRRSNELRQHQERLKSYDGVDPQTIAAFRKQQEEARAARLPMWAAKHPEHPKFQELKTRWREANSAYQRLAHGKSPEDQDALRAQVLAGFSPDEQRTMREFSQHQSTFMERLAADPDGTLQEMLDTRVNQILSQREQQFAQRQQAEQSVGEWFNDQRNGAVLNTQREWMISALEQGAPWSLVRLEAENRHLKSQLGAQTSKVLSAEERSRLAKGNAAISRDPVTAPVDDDPYEYAVKTAREKGIEVGGPRWIQHIASLNLKQ